MKCPACKSENSTVIDTRRYDETIRRVRNCEDCGHVWATYEMNEKAITIYTHPTTKLLNSGI